MNLMQARKDQLLDLLNTPVPIEDRRRLSAELADLKQDIVAHRHDDDERVWDDMRRKWGQHISSQRGNQAQIRHTLL
ncbi:hypothetical protein [Bifidobacterium mongoliense]|uniref:Uncharacterized protein n=1 Tax=Bifidobacterium mongoliense DSM 21395 TaxID=1437603 RepID=A0A087BZS2_9BIFI|nr:hypothetical protein [Bifidobacterium mongoliense]KFI76522.1 hypothetical protein BMON_1912 [Bifidobacterium mongoliense DSM 21395]